MGGRYYCEYCDKTFPDNSVNRRTHLNGTQHQQARKLHYDQYLSGFRVRSALSGLAAQEKYAVESSKKPCIAFVRTGSCNYGVSCKYSHQTPEEMLQLQQAATEPHHLFSLATVRRKNQ
ncbi:unnamed protein product [Dicrocoelium dendriticum]|nr:unnamed protein product [Dicrocoelium dendriticum]